MTAPNPPTPTELRRLAEAATPGNWRLIETTKWAGGFIQTDGHDSFRINPFDMADKRDSDLANAAFVAAFNPTTALALLDDNASQAAEIAGLREALTPSGDTKAAYHGEFTMPVTVIHYDDDGEPEEVTENIPVPWTTVKEIMAAILARTATDTGSRAGG